jgi:phosphoenolpyruvate-protein kinase (PTS system EI component)
MESEIAKRFVKGIPASPGIVIGKACVFQDIFLRVEGRGLKEEHVEQEVLRLKQAIHQVTKELMEDKLVDKRDRLRILRKFVGRLEHKKIWRSNPIRPD